MSISQQKWPTERLCQQAAESTGLGVMVTKPGGPKPGRGAVPPSDYALWMQTKSGEWDYILSHEDLQTIKLVLIGIELGGSYHK